MDITPEIANTWQPILKQASHSMPPSLPDIAAEQRGQVIELWRQQYQQATAEQRVGLAVFAYQLGVHEYALKMLAEEDYQKRLSGVRLLGYMRDESVWPQINELAHHEDTEISLTAFAAMTSINEGRAIEDCLDLIASRASWPIERVADILREALENEATN
jgi:hypothetical protein